MLPVLHPRVVVITGASSGIGEACAYAFATGQGSACKLVLVGRRTAELERVAAACELLGASARVARCDVSVEVERAALVTSVVECEGACNVLVNNAGIGSRLRHLDDDSVERISDVINTNLVAAMDLTCRFLPLLRSAVRASNGSGSVVDIASVAGFTPLPTSAIYCASKFGLTGWSRSLSAALAPEGIHVSCIAPGPIPTPGFPHRELMSRPWLSRLLSASPEQVAGLVVAAAAGKARYRTIPRPYGLLRIMAAVSPRLAHRFALRMAGRSNTKTPESS